MSDSPAQTGSPSRPTILAALGAMLLCAYAPFAWVISIDYPWSEYRWTWVKMWPALPGLFPSILLTDNLPESSRYALMAAVTALLLGLAVWCGTRSRRALLVTALVLLVGSAIHSWGAYHVFLA